MYHNILKCLYDNREQSMPMSNLVNSLHSSDKGKDLETQEFLNIIERMQLKRLIKIAEDSSVSLTKTGRFFLEIRYNFPEKHLDWFLGR